MEEQDQYPYVVTPEITAGYKVRLVQQQIFFDFTPDDCPSRRNRYGSGNDGLLDGQMTAQKSTFHILLIRTPRWRQKWRRDLSSTPWKNKIDSAILSRRTPL